MNSRMSCAILFLAFFPALAALAGDDGPKEVLPPKTFIGKNVGIKDNLWDGVDSNNCLRTKGGHLNTLRHGTSRGDYHVGPSISFADVTGDGRPDLVVGGEKGFMWYFEQVSKNGTFPPRFESGRFIHMQCSVDSLLHVDASDMDADGKLDLVYSSDTGEIFYIRNLGNGFFKTGAPQCIFSKEPYRGRGFTHRFYDWDNDGLFDLYFGDASYSANAVYFFKNHGSQANPSFNNTDPNMWLCYGYGKEMLDPCHGDLNGDGRMDVLVADSEGHFHMYYAPEKQDPENPVLLDYVGMLTVDGSDAPVGEGARCFLYDVDRDGLLDLFFSDQKGFFYLSRNIGAPGRPAFGKYTKLKGKDLWKPYKTLVDDWQEEQLWPKNSAPVAKLRTEELVADRMTGETKKINYIRLDFADGYVGGSGAFTRHGLHLKDGVDYRISFKTRGQGGKGNLYMEQWWEGERRGDTIHQTKYGTNREFPLRSEFSEVSFVHDAHHSSKDMTADDGIYFLLHFQLLGEATNAYMDIYDMTMTPIIKESRE